MGQSTIDGLLTVKKAANGTSTSDSELFAEIHLAVENSGNFGSWVKFVFHPTQQGHDAFAEIEIYNHGTVDTFGKDLHSFIKSMHGLNLLCSGELYGETENTRNRWFITVENNEVSFTNTEVKIVHTEASSFEDMVA